MLGLGIRGHVAAYEIVTRKSLLVLGTGLAAVLALSLPAQAQNAAASAGQVAQTEAAADIAFNIPAQALPTALLAFGQQSGSQVIATSDLAQGQTSSTVVGKMKPEEALARLLVGTTLTYRITDEGAFSLFAQPTQGEVIPTLQPLEVTAARTPQAISDIPGSVMTIESDEIAEQVRMNRNPADLLRKKVPGFAVPNVTISGASENLRGRDILIMVDGVKRDTPLRDVSRVLSLIDLNNVERIEVISGPSAVYGAGATGGTINFITKKATAGKPQVTLSTGFTAFTADFDDSITPDASVTVTGDAGFVDYAITASGSWSQNSYDGSGHLMPSDPEIGQGGRDNADDYTLSAKIGRDFDGQRLEAQADVIWYDQTPDYFTDYSTDPASVDKDADYQGKSIQERSNYVTARYTNDDISIGELSVAIFHNDIEKRFAFAPLSAANSIVYFCGPTEIQCKDAQGTLFVEQAGMTATVVSPLDFALDGMTLTWGFDYTYDETKQENLDGTDIIAPMKQHGAGAFAQVSAPVFDWLTLSGGVRYEHYNLHAGDFRRPAVAALIGGAVFTLPGANVEGADFVYDATLFNAGAVVHVTDELDVYGGFSQGFQVPDLGGFTRRSGFSGFPLDWGEFTPRAAKVDNYEVGLRGNWESFRGTLSAFYNTSDYGTNFDPAANTLTQQPEEIYGIEATAEFDVTDSLTIGTVLGYQEGKQDRDDDGDYEAYLPNNRINSPFRGTLYVEYLTDFDLGLRAEALYFSGRDEFDGTIQFKLDDAVTVNFLANYPLLGGDLSFAVENLLDETYENPTSTATRNIPINGYGRTVGLHYTRTF